MPEMNHAYAEVEGKPALVRPAHINLGHRDRPREARRHPPAARAEHQARASTMDFAAVLGGLRGRRPARPHEQARRRRLRRHHDQPDQPRHDRHRPLGAAADARPGHDHRRRRHGLPGRVPGRLEETLARLRGQQDHDADVDLRPPDHPGRAVRRVPAHRAPLLLGEDGFYDDLPRAAHPLRADPLGAATSPTRTTTTSTRPPGCRS